MVLNGRNPDGGTQLFSSRGVRPRFPKCGACELIIATIFNIGGLRGILLAKVGFVEAKISFFFLRRGSCELTVAQWDPCELRERREEGVFRAAHPYNPF